MGLKSTRHSKKKGRGRRKTAKGGSRALGPSRLSPAKENAIAEIKGHEAAVKATQMAELAQIQGGLARGAAIKAIEVSTAIDHARFRDGRQDPRLKLTINRNGIYKGEVEDGKRHGFGVYKTAYTTYKGEWKNDMRHGVGVFIQQELASESGTGYRYEGDWKDGEMNGCGICVFANFDVYMGSHKDDEFDGYGVYTHYATGGTHKCAYKAGVKDGYGTYNAGARSHSGLYVKDRFVLGRGNVPSREGIYTGNLKNDTGTGNGKMTYTTGDVYEGQFKKYKRHGMGKLTKDNGRVEEGFWSGAGDRMKGTITYPEGHIEEGSFEYGVPVPPLTQIEKDAFSGEDTDRD